MSKKPTGTRVHLLAKELDVNSKDIIAKCQAEGIEGITNHMSAVSVGLEATLREWFDGSGTGSGAVTAIETAAPVDVSKARAKSARKAARMPAATAIIEDESATVMAPEAMAAATAPLITSAPEPLISASAAPMIEAPPPHDERADQVATKPEIDGHTVPLQETVASPAAIAPAPSPPSRRKHESPVQREEPPAFKPVMNDPKRPDVVSPAGPMLQRPVKTKLAGPKVIRVEAPEVMDKPRPAARRDVPGPISRVGPRAGRGAGFGQGTSDSTGDARGGRGGAGGAAARGRNNKRRSATADDAGRSALAPSRGPGAAEDTSFNWRAQDLLEREQRLNKAGGFFRNARRDNLKKASNVTHRAHTAAQTGGKVQITEPIVLKELSARTGIKVNDIIRKLVQLGKDLLSPTAALDAGTAAEIMLEWGIELEVVAAESAGTRVAKAAETRESKDVRSRSPVVTILGHVDHGKTSLLDKIRNTNVAAGEAGGITQKTSAFQVPVKAGDKERVITFIDTPGHEAFTEMRARGAKVTDIVVLVVAADDGVMPQTVESINHAKAAGVPIVVALNKIDKSEATDSNIQRILGQLADRELNPVEWGGSTEVVRTSATKGIGIQDLLELLDYQADLLELTADFDGHAVGTVLEAKMEEGRGPVANVLVQQGRLAKGDPIVLGRAFGKVRDIINDRGQRVDEAGPSQPVVISGMDEIPDAGDKFYVPKTLQAAEGAAQERRQLERQKDLAREKVTLDNIFQKLAEAGVKELPIVLKADVQGSLETLKPSLEKISSEDVKIVIKHAAIGGINESDVLLSEASGAIVIGFNVTASSKARKLADSHGVDIRLYDVIYDVTDDVRKAAEGMLEPEHKLEVLGHAEVRDVFKITRVGMIAGCYVTDGVIERNSQIRVTRNGIVIEKDRRLEQLKRFKDDVKEVRAGQECGMKIDGYSDIKNGDILECYKTLTVRRTLEVAARR